MDGLVQERHSSIVNALELRLSCTNPSGVVLLRFRSLSSCSGQCYRTKTDWNLHIQILKPSRKLYFACHQMGYIVSCVGTYMYDWKVNLSKMIQNILSPRQSYNQFSYCRIRCNRHLELYGTDICTATSRSYIIPRWSCVLVSLVRRISSFTHVRGDEHYGQGTITK